MMSFGFTRLIQRSALRDYLEFMLLVAFVLWVTLSVDAVDAQDVAQEVAQDVAQDAAQDAAQAILADSTGSAGQEVTDAVNLWVKQGYLNYETAVATRCSDEAFVRRIHLDLIGRTPTPTESLDWMQSDRDRDKLIDSLISQEGFVQNFADFYDSLLMGRTAEGTYEQRKQHQWRAYLEGMVRENRPWTEVVEEILLARPLSEEQKGAVWFLYERNNDHQKIAESIAPAIFGLRIECAQCHDHMMVDEIKQSHYWGLVAFFNRSKNEKSEGVLRVSESAVGGFSEFADIEGSSTPNYLTFLDTEVVPEERPEKSDKQEDSDGLYLTSERPQVGRVPKFSRREKFVQEVLRDHPRLALAFTNRIWAILMGRGIVHPFDEMDSMHEPSHPELLDWLSKDTKAHQFDLRRLVRGLVRSEAYQKSSVRPKGAEDPATFAWYIERPLTGEQLARSTMQVLHGRGDAEAVGIFRQQFPEVLPRDYVTTVKKALFLTNSDDFDRLIQSSTAPDDLVPRLISSGSRKDQIDQLFQTVFARTPDAGEREAIGDYLDNRRDDPTQAMQQVVWSMLTSAEFRFNH